MDIYRAIKLVIRYFWLLALIPMIMGGLMFFATKSQPKEFFSKATIFTGITSGHSIESQGRDRVDYFATTVAFDNMLNILKSKSVLEEVGLRLFTQNIMLEAPHPRFISAESLNDLKEITPDEVKGLIVNNNFEETYQRFVAYKNQSEDNFLYELLNLKHRHYSIEGLSRVNARRVQGSDLLEISYRADDPGITYQTLVILIDVFFSKHSALKMAQTTTVVEYFERQLAAAWRRLEEEENRLLEFNRENRIINYHEQTKYVASQKEQFELSVKKTQLEYGAALSVLDRLENEIENRHDVNIKTKRIGQLRNQLLMTNQAIQRIEIFEQQTESLEVLPDLIRKKESLENGIRLTVDSLFMLERNIDGVEREFILGQWFDNMLQLESAAARLKVLDGKRAEFDSLYMFFAPLGATINRIERTIGVLEREYLSILHNLGLAKLKQQNLELSANMDLLDEPFLPILTQPSKRKLYVLVIAMFSFFFVLAAIFVIELLDKRLKTVSKLEKRTELKAAGAILSQRKSKGVDIDNLSRRAITLFVSDIMQLIMHKHGSKPLFIQVFSNWGNEGKTFFINKLRNQLVELGYTASLLSVSDDLEENEHPENAWNITSTQYRSVKSFEQWRSNPDDYPWTNSDFVIMELPAMSSFLLNHHLCSEGDINLLLVNASRTWSSADDHYLEKLKNVSGDHLFAVLNNVTADNIEEYIGDIPKKRSVFRRFIKNRLLKRYIGFHP